MPNGFAFNFATNWCEMSMVLWSKNLVIYVANCDVSVPCACYFDQNSPHFCDQKVVLQFFCFECSLEMPVGQMNSPMQGAFHMPIKLHELIIVCG